MNAGKRIDFLDIIHLLAGKIHWLLLTGGLCGGIAWLAATFLITPQYEAHITMYVYNNPEHINQNSSISNADLQASESLAKTYIEILQSNRVVNSIREGLELREQLPQNEMKKMLKVTTVNGTQLLKVSVTSADAQLAYEIAEGFAKLGPKEIADITKVGSAELVDHAELPQKPVYPVVIRYAVSGFFAGVLAAVVFFLVKAWTDYTLYDSEDVEKATGLIVLGQIQEIAGYSVPVEYRKLTAGGIITYEKEKETETGGGPVK